VIERIFQGAHYLYRVRLPSGSVVHSLRQHYQVYEIGSAVGARIDPGHGLTCFVNGQLRAIPFM
jgi:hypothetical protein